LVVGGNVGKERVGARCVIDAATEVAETIGDDEITGTENHVVTDNLVENMLGDFDGGGLVLDYDERGAGAVGDKSVATALDAILDEGNLIAHKSGREILGMDEERDKMLTDKFFGSEGDKTMTKLVEDLRRAIDIADAEVGDG
jgi:hypothetical protein